MEMVFPSVQNNLSKPFCPARSAYRLKPCSHSTPLSFFSLFIPLTSLTYLTLSHACHSPILPSRTHSFRSLISLFSPLVSNTFNVPGFTHLTFGMKLCLFHMRERLFMAVIIFGPSPALYGRVRRFHSFRTVVALVMVLWGHSSPAPAPRAVPTGKHGPRMPMQGDRLEHPVRTRCTKPALALTEAALPSCRDGCGRSAKTTRSTLCSVCFMKKAQSSGARSGGNLKAKGSFGHAGNPKAKGSFGNAGNPKAKGSFGNAGNPKAKGSVGNAGNPKAKGSFGHAGNPKAKGSVANAGNMNADHAEMAKRRNLKHTV